ncbi:sodium:solute symporter family protein [Clostridium malenominatum]|uniref:Sodium:solute symporter family protein n=1 Tax=Clostridium malenominatum TaxID=1539 RepID=A0ABP3TW21_9CLOT
MLVLLLFCSLFIAAGYIVSKNVSSGTDFLVAGRNLPIVFLTFTIAATHFGGGALVGGIEQGASKGVWAGMYAIIGYAIACFINAFVAPKFRRASNNLTPPDFIETRYGYSKFLRGYHVFVYILGTVAIISAQFNAFGGIAAAFGISRTPAIILGAVSVMIYTFMAGMWGVAVTDFMQLLICMIFLPIVSFVGLNALNTQTGVTLGTLLSAPFFETPDAAGSFMYSLIPTIVGSMFAYEYFLRFQSAKSEKDARNSSLIAGVLLLLLAIPVGIIGAMGQRLYPTVPANEVLGHVVNETLPVWAGYIFLGAVLAAIMSTADSLMTSLSGMVTRDIYHKLLNPDKDFDTLPNTLKMARITTVIGCAIAMLISLKFRSIIGLLFWPSPLQSGVLFAPIIIGMFWNRASRKGAYASVIIGACVALIDMLGICKLPERMFVTMAAATFALVVVSILNPDKPVEITTSSEVK